MAEGEKLKPLDSKVTICQAPWTALEINPLGEVSTDSQCTSILGNLGNQTLSEILSGEKLKQLRANWSSGSHPQECSNCLKKERSIGHSRRIFFDHKLGEKSLGELQLLERQRSIDYLELNFSNLCNLKCRMCNSVSSSSWVKDEEKMKQLNGLEFALPKQSKVRTIDNEIFEKLVKDPSVFRNLKMLALRGGEPLLNPLVQQLLELLVERGLSKNITLDISTNGTNLNHRLLGLFKDFKSVDLYISIEGAGALYQYIRGGAGYSLRDLEKKLPLVRQLPNTTIIFAVTVSVYNILYLNDLIAWFESVADDRDEFVMSNVVVRPEFLNFQILPDFIKGRARKNLENNIFLVERSKQPGRRFPDSGYHLVLDALSKEIYSIEKKAQLMTQFIKYNKAVDDIRSEKLSDVAPELNALLLTATSACSPLKDSLS